MKAAPIDGLTVGADYLDFDGVVNSTTQSPGQDRTTLLTLQVRYQLVTAKTLQLLQSMLTVVT